MKKTLKISVALVICAIVCVCGLTVFGGMNKDTFYKSDYCNTIKTIKYALVIKEDGDNTLKLYREEFSAEEDAECRATDDYEKVDDYSSADWQLYGNSEPYKKSVIKSLTVENGISVIGKNAFRGQSSLKTVILPASLTEIKDGAFDGCTAIDTVIFRGTEAEWNAITKGADNTVFESVQITFSPVKAGDVNGDGKVTVSDCVSIGLYIANQKDLNDAALTAGDVTHNGKVDGDDAELIAQYISKRVSSLEIISFKQQGVIDLTDPDYTEDDFFK